MLKPIWTQTLQWCQSSSCLRSAMMLKKFRSTNNRSLNCPYLPWHWVLPQSHQEVFEKCSDIFRGCSGFSQCQHLHREVVFFSRNRLLWKVFHTHATAAILWLNGNCKRCLTPIYTRLKLEFNSCDQSDRFVWGEILALKQISVSWPPKKWLSYNNIEMVVENKVVVVS